MTALHTAHEAGWLNAGQDSLFDISWLVRNGSVQASLITGVLGIQAMPTVVEVVGWLLYLVPVGLYVGWPPGRRVPWRAVSWASLARRRRAARSRPSPLRSPHLPSRRACRMDDAGQWSHRCVDDGRNQGDRPRRTRGSAGRRADPAALGNRRRRRACPPPLRRSAAQLNGGRLPIGVTAADVAQPSPSTTVQTSPTPSTSTPTAPAARCEPPHDGDRDRAAGSGPLVLENVRDTTLAAAAAARRPRIRRRPPAITADRASWGIGLPDALRDRGRCPRRAGARRRPCGSRRTRRSAPRRPYPRSCSSERLAALG